MIGAANRDPAQFDQPDQLVLSRKPNRHLAFAGGPHLCVGFQLARMEGRIAINRFLKKYPNYKLTGRSRAWWTGAFPRLCQTARDTGSVTKSKGLKMTMMQLESYAGGKWVGPSGNVRKIYSAVTGEEIAEAGSDSLNFQHMIDYAKQNGGPRAAQNDLS